MKNYLIVLIFLLSSCCKNSATQKQINNNVLKITEKCAVIYNPDSLKINKAKSLNEEGFYVSADDAMYYISEARNFLDSINVKVISTKSYYIDFYKDNQCIKHFDLNSDNNFWGIIIYNGKDLPIEVDITNIEEDFNKYWN